MLFPCAVATVTIITPVMTLSYVDVTETDDQREYRAYDSVATFENARSVCVASDGDLVTQRASYNNTYAAQLFSEFSLR